GSGAKMGVLIDALLSLARLSRKQLKRDRVDISALAGEAAAGLMSANPERQGSMTIAAGVEAGADRELVRVVLENLLSNAFKYSAKTPGARIEVGMIGAEFFVKDNGAGFDMADAGQLFAPFQRLHTPAEFPGTGIGLATVQRIVN